MWFSISKRMLALGGTIAAGLLLTGPLAHANDKTPVTFGFVTPTSTSWGEDVMRGVDLAVKEINASGGIDGHPVKIVTYDDQNKPEEGASAVERLITRDKVKIVMGSFTSSSSMAQQAVTKRYGKLHIVSFAQADSVRDASHPLAFFLNATVGMNMSAYLKYVAKKFDPKRLVVFADQSDYGESSIAAVKSNYGKPGDPELVGVERFDGKQMDLSPQLTKIRGLKPDAVLIAADSGEKVSNALTQMHQLGVPGMRLTVPGILSESFVKLTGAAGEGMINGDFYYFKQDNPTNLAFVKNFRAAYKYAPSKLELIGYESVELGAQVVRKAGVDADDEAMAKVLRDTTWTTPRGDWTFVPMGKAYQAAINNFTLLTVKNGEIVPVK